MMFGAASIRSLSSVWTCPQQAFSQTVRPTIHTSVVIANGRPRDSDGYRWISVNEKVLRSMPLYVGSASFAFVLLNRSFSGIAAVADASSGQSRADVLCLALATTVLLTGLVWKSIEPKPLVTVSLIGVYCKSLFPSLPTAAAEELIWAWKALEDATQSRALVVIYFDTLILQAGIAAESPEVPGTAIPINVLGLLQGSICQSVKNSGKQVYLANLTLFPGRSELPFLPTNSQAVIVQPLGEDGVLIVASDTVRGFSPLDQVCIVHLAIPTHAPHVARVTKIFREPETALDSVLQAWIGTLGDKLNSTLATCTSLLPSSANFPRL